jgi:tRNA (guanine6-N2)-methyltransferase
MQIIAACSDGLGDIVAGELQELGFTCGTVRSNGVELVNTVPDNVIKLNIFTRTVSRIYIRIGSAQLDTLKQISEFCAEIRYSDWFDESQSFAIRGKREGRHDFTSMDMARDVGSAVVGHFQKITGRRIPVDLDNPDIEIHAVLKGNRFELLINTSGRALEYRYQRPFQHFAPIRPTIAAALLRLSSYRDSGNLLDPMAGGGTIAIEAVMKALNIAPGLYRPGKDYLFSNLRCVGSAGLEFHLDDARNKILNKPLIRVLAADRFRKNVCGMIENFDHFGIAQHITVRQGLAETLSYVVQGEYTRIVTNPPYGMRIGSVKLTEQLYRNFAKASAEKEIREVVALTPLKKTWIHSFMDNGYSISHSRLAQFGNLHVSILIASLK